ncbi:MAG: indole-3-glycerol phosphate synthase TrpC [Candidatus Binataceae bacterium]|nr:indole-3-glycerol phosphate synthase TrpC [Candidatus Binataceae bacterium]
MSSVLEQILAAKRLEVAERRRSQPNEVVIEQAQRASAAKDFIGALRSERPAIIAEIKRASPSKGDILPNLDPIAVARDYRVAGAAALSILTDRHFKGTLEDLRTVREAIDLPILRKDFMFDPYQVYEARAAGADCILLIAAMLPEREIHALAAIADELKMASLVEVHNREEFDLAQRMKARLIGINNRDLHTFRTSLTTTEELLRDYAGDALIVAESGINSASDIGRLAKAGARAFLIGESLLREGQPQTNLAALINGFDGG